MTDSPTICDLSGCGKPATLLVRWCSPTTPWEAPMCDACRIAAWEFSTKIGNVDGWAYVALAAKSAPAP